MDFDHSARVISLANLKAMCARVSDWRHYYSIIKQTKTAVHVEYSSLDSYGPKDPIIAMFPTFAYVDITGVVFTANKTSYEPEEDCWLGHKYFSPLRDCPILYHHADQWMTEAEIREA